MTIDFKIVFGNCDKPNSTIAENSSKIKWIELSVIM
jgi:hypothetical protein